MRCSIQNQAIVHAFNKGYRVRCSVVRSPSGKIRILSTDDSGYRRFTIAFEGRRVSIKVHKLLAYEKFGDIIFEEDITVRHKDSNETNNSWDNMKIGTLSKNRMDMPKERRLASAIKASSYTRRFTDKEMEEIRTEHSKCKSYFKVMEKFNITSKGTLHHILNIKYQTKKE